MCEACTFCTTPIFHFCSAFATMGIKDAFARSSVTQYAQSIRAAPREVIRSPTLLRSSLLYALAGVPMSKYAISCLHYLEQTLTVSVRSLGPRSFCRHPFTARLQEAVQR